MVSFPDNYPQEVMVTTKGFLFYLLYYLSLTFADTDTFSLDFHFGHTTGSKSAVSNGEVKSLQLKL